MEFEGRVAVVTGAANGIGRACALHMAQNGADLVVLDLEEGPLRQIAAEIAAVGRKVTPYQLDLTDYALVEKTFARIHADQQRVDILINNVGQTGRERISEFWQSTPDVWKFVIDVSLMTTLNCTRQVVGGMRERRSGRIVNISSEAAITGDATIADYAAAKAGVIGFTRSLAREVGPFQVTVNAVLPGGTKTRATERIPKEFVESALKQIPMGRMNDPEDIANAVGFFASEKARFITGQTLLVNGGRVFN
ncbi:SDR family oxidoreductase [Bradyrhizobium sp. 153]|uniref:SDR family NAD(P)-dependent oxidoreductase n=1 Tax=Bradyrhizobium sp. 153 TaxID=2782627 RepID=UPI001FF8398D|nr:SDR family oxidoreductase [Bradyrhizobium sp. 153]